jgi:hypothetical protein
MSRNNAPIVTRSSRNRRRDRGSSAVAAATTDELESSSVVLHHGAVVADYAAAAVAPPTVAAAGDNASVWIRTMMPTAAAATFTNYSMDVLDGGGTTAHVNAAVTASSTANRHFGYRGDPTLTNDQDVVVVTTGDTADATTAINDASTTHAKIGSLSRAPAEFSINTSAIITTTAMMMPKTVGRHYGDSPSRDEDNRCTNDTATADDVTTTDIPEIVLQDSDVLSGTGKVCIKSCEFATSKWWTLSRWKRWLI